MDVNGKQVVGYVTNSTRKLIDALEVPITRNLGSLGILWVERKVLGRPKAETKKSPHPSIAG